MSLCTLSKVEFQLTYRPDTSTAVTRCIMTKVRFTGS